MNKFLKETIIPSISYWFPEKQLKLLDYNYEKYVDVINIQDIDGYKYSIQWSAIKNNYKRGSYFDITNCNNYATDNVKLYLSRHFPDIKLVSDYIGGRGTFSKNEIEVYDSLSGIKKCKFTNKTTITIESICNLIELNGFEPILDMIKFKGNTSILYYKCSKHGIKHKSYSAFEKNPTCRECDVENMTHGNSSFFLKSEIENELYLKNPNVVIINCPEKVNNKTKVKCECKEHTNHKWDTDIRSIRVQKYVCKFCGFDAKSGDGHHGWQGGITPMHNYLRQELREWKYDSMKDCNYKCLITGKRFDTIHHKHSFSLILKETYNTLNIDVKDNTSDYTNEELLMIRNKLIELHYRYGFGACLTENSHKLFHSIYGYGDNTIEQWNEFYNNYKL